MTAQKIYFKNVCVLYPVSCNLYIISLPKQSVTHKYREKNMISYYVLLYFFKKNHQKSVGFPKYFITLAIKFVHQTRVSIKDNMYFKLGQYCDKSALWDAHHLICIVKHDLAKIFKKSFRVYKVVQKKILNSHTTIYFFPVNRSLMHIENGAN